MSLYEKLMNAAFRFLSYRNRSEYEVVEYLRKKAQIYKKDKNEDAKQVIEQVLVRLKELEYIDDHAFVQWWIEQRSSRKPKGVRAIELELLRKGVSKDIIDTYTSQIDNDEQVRIAKTYIKNKEYKLKKLTGYEKKRKIFQILFQRGFSSEIINQIIDEMIKKD